MYFIHYLELKKDIDEAPEKILIESLQLEELKEYENSLTKINSSIEEKVKGLSELIS